MEDTQSRKKENTFDENDKSDDENVSHGNGDQDNGHNQQQRHNELCNTSNSDQASEKPSGDYCVQMMAYQKQKRMQSVYTSTAEPDWLIAFDKYCKTVEDETSSLPVQQVVLGCCPGVLFGCALSKIGKYVAVAAGCSIVAVQIVDSTGMRKVRWNDMIEDAKYKKNKIVCYKNVPSLEQVSRTFGKHRNMTAGFVGGILFGLGIF